jgi:hypothetical protein
MGGSVLIDDGYKELSSGWTKSCCRWMDRQEVLGYDAGGWNAGAGEGGGAG